MNNDFLNDTDVFTVTRATRTTQRMMEWWTMLCIPNTYGTSFNDIDLVHFRGENMKAPGTTISSSLRITSADLGDTLEVAWRRPTGLMVKASVSGMELAEDSGFESQVGRVVIFALNWTGNRGLQRYFEKIDIEYQE